MAEPLHVVFAANRAYVPYFSAALVSLRDNLDPAVSLHVTLLTRDVVPTDVGWPNRLGGDALVCFEPVIGSGIRLPIRPTDHLTIETYYRLFLDSAFDGSVSRVVYLDSDLVVLGDLAALARVPLEGKTVAAALDLHVRDWSRGCAPLRSVPHAAGVPYFNAGVLLIDLAAWRARRVRERALEFLEVNADRIQFWDQDALNSALVGDWVALDPRWNRMSHYWAQREAGSLPFSAAVNASLADPYVVHFASGIKPWRAYRHPDRREYDRYALMAGFPRHRMTFIKAAMGRLARMVPGFGRSPTAGRR